MAGSGATTIRKPYQIHAFSEQVQAAMQALHVRDNVHGPLQVLEDWLVVLSSAYAAEMLRDTWAFPLAFLLAVALIGGRQRGLADLLHQASHGALARNRTWNNILGSVCSGYFVLQSFTGYYRSHVLSHHVHLGDPKRDPDYAELIRAGICGPQRTTRNILKYILAIFHPRTTLNYILYLIRHRILPADESSRERPLRLAFLVTVGCIAWWIVGLRMLVLYWVLPLLTTSTYIGALAELLEHYPLIDTAPRLDLFMTRNRICGWIFNLFLGVHAEGFHLVHHLFPRLPSWNLEAAHRILMADAAYAALHAGGEQTMISLLLETVDVDARPWEAAAVAASAAAAKAASAAATVAATVGTEERKPPRADEQMTVPA